MKNPSVFFDGQIRRNITFTKQVIRIPIPFLLVGWFALPLSLPVSAQQATPGATVEVHASVRNDTSESLESVKSLLPTIRRALEPRVYPPPRLNLKRLTAIFTQGRKDTALQSKEGPTVPIKLIASVDGLGRGFLDSNGHPMRVTGIPPDTNGAVGDVHYVQVVNTYFAIFNKADLIKAGTKPTKPVSPVFGWAPISVIWRGFGGKCEENNDGDPIVEYDKIAKRWVITQMRTSGGGFSECIAVSASSDATGAYHRYEFNQPSLNDYPKMGVWPDGYYITYNMYDGVEGARICAYERSKMLEGKPAGEIAVQLDNSFWSLLPSDFDGLPDAEHLPPPNSPCYFLSLGTTANTLDFWKFHVDWTDPAKSTFGNNGPNATLQVEPFTDAPTRCPSIPQLGSCQLDAVGERLLYRLAYRRFADHESLVTNHSVQGETAIAACRWYEICNPGGVPTIAQQGTFSPDETSRWVSSIAMDGSGDIGLGYSASSASSHPSIRITAQKGGAPRGILGSEQIVINGKSSQQGDYAERWGDYSSMAIDPVDDTTFWFTTEYLATANNASFNWSTRIIAFKVGQ
jgi:hypothetical protein